MFCENERKSSFCIPDKSQVTLATHVLQWIYVSHSGFRFPFAHFATSEAQASELFCILWRALDKLEEWGFKVC